MQGWSSSLSKQVNSGSLPVLPQGVKDSEMGRHLWTIWAGPKGDHHALRGRGNPTEWERTGTQMTDTGLAASRLGRTRGGAPRAVEAG